MDPLGAHNFFSLQDTTRIALQSKLRELSFSKGQLVFSEGDTTTDICFVLLGIVRLVKLSPSGKIISFRFIEKGGFFGELAMIDRLPRSTTGYAETDVTMGFLNHTDAQSLINEHAGFTWLLLKQLADTVRKTTSRLEHLHFLNAHQRVFTALIELAPSNIEYQKNFEILIPPQEHWAQLLDISRETLARAIGILIEAKIIRKTGRSIEVLNWTGLIDLANQI